MTSDDSQTGANPAKTGGFSAESKLDETAFVRPDTSVGLPQPTGVTPSAQGWVGKSIGKYTVTGVLGQGGMGLVLKAHDPIIDRDVAIKVLASSLANDAASLGRFLSEAKAAGKLSHPNVIAVYEIHKEGESHFLVLEYVAGKSLNDIMARQQYLTVLEATQAMIDACKGVGAAHAVGLIHRDIKPANLMRTTDGSTKVADFGLAKATGDSGRHFTQTGIVVGTPFFMSPEQCEVKPLDNRSDIYSLGATYYSLLSGNNPYQDSESVPQLMYLHCHGPIPDPRTVNPAVPEACSRIVARAMAKSPADRYQSTSEMLADLVAVMGALSGQTNIALPSDTASPEKRKSGASVSVAPLSGAAKGGNTGARRFKPIWVIPALAAMAGAFILGVIFLPRGSSPGGDGPGPNSGAPGAGVDGGSAGEVVLGMSAPFSGPAAELGREMEIGIRTYFDQLNETGGIARRKVRLVALDDGYEPDRARANMELLSEKHKAFAIIGNVGTPTAEKTLPYALEKKMLFFGGFTGAPLLRKDPPDRFVFNYRASYEEETAAIFSYLVDVKKIRPEQIGVFLQQDGYGDAGLRGVLKTLRKHGGDADKLLKVGHARNTVAVDDAVQKVVESSDLAAVIMVSTYRPASVFIQKVKDARKAKGAKKDLIFANVSFVGSNALADELSQMGPQYADGVIVTQVVPHINSQALAVLKYRELLGKYYPNAKPNFVSLEGYIDAMILAEGLKRTGANLTTDTLIETLESIRHFDLGIGTSVNFGPSEHQASHKVWGTILDSAGRYQILELD